MTFGQFPQRLGCKWRCLTKFGGRLITKIPLKVNPSAKLLEIILYFGFIYLLWIGALSRPFSRTFVSLSVKTFWLKLNTVSEQKYPESVVFPVALASLLLSIFCKSTKMEISSLSWVEKISVSLDSTNEQDEFWKSEELVECWWGGFHFRRVSLFGF